MAVAKPKLFLFAGQSNMAGVGDWSSLTAAERASVSNVRVFSADPNHAPPITQPPSFQYWLPPQGVFINYAQWSDTGLSWNATNPAQYATVNNFGPEFTTVRDLASGLGEHIYLAKYALGGTGLDASFATMGGGTWYFNATDPGLPAEYSQSLYHSMVSWANKALAAARQIEPETEFAGFFWLQGEADALLPNTANSYNNNLTIFIQHLRSDLGMAHLPVVIGRIADKATILIGAGTVRTAQKAVAKPANNAAWVDTDGLAMDPTQLHYLDAGLKTIGQRFAQAWLDLKRPPAVTNGNGATNVLGTSATLSGNLVSTGGATTSVSIFWDLADGGTNNLAWNRSVSLGTRTAGSFSTNISGLVAGSWYYYRCRTINSYGETWSGPSVSFIALPGAVPPAPTVSNNTPVYQGATVALTATSPYTTDPSAFTWNGPALSNLKGNNLSYANAQPDWSGAVFGRAGSTAGTSNGAPRNNSNNFAVLLIDSTPLRLRRSITCRIPRISGFPPATGPSSRAP